MGYDALNKNLDSNASTAIGTYALNVNPADSNAAFGYNALGANQAEKTTQQWVPNQCIQIISEIVLRAWDIKPMLQQITLSTL